MSAQEEGRQAEAVPVRVEPSQPGPYVRDLSVFDKDFTATHVRNFAPVRDFTVGAPVAEDFGLTVEDEEEELGDPKDSSALASAESGASTSPTQTASPSTDLPWEQSAVVEKDDTTPASEDVSGTPTSPEPTSPGKTKQPAKE